MSSRHMVWFLALALFSGPQEGVAQRSSPGAGGDLPDGLRLDPEQAKFGARPSQLWRALGHAAVEPWVPGVHKSRGLALGVYRDIAPATVVVRTPSGHGSGIVVEGSGWILTNAHCVSMGRTDPATGTLTVQVNVGRLQNELVEVDRTAIPAIVYKKSENKDLALLKLENLPKGIQSLPAIELASDSPLPGTDCVAVGHPAAGMLWTVRSCEVVNAGIWPEKQIDFAVARLNASTDEAKNLLETLASQMPKLKILMSSCGLNPGDSGGPLVDRDHRLIGVTFAIPASDFSQGVSLDKFSYHIHVDEVRDFLKVRPEKPPLNVPDPWPPATFHMIFDLDEDNLADTLIFGMHPDAPPTGLMVDLDQNFLPHFSEEEFTELGEMVDWDFEFAWHPMPERRGFYDTDDDGQFDLVLIDSDGDESVDIDMILREGTWMRKESRGPVVRDPRLVPEAMRARFEKIIKVIRAHDED